MIRIFGVRNIARLMSNVDNNRQIVLSIVLTKGGKAAHRFTLSKNGTMVIEK